MACNWKNVSWPTYVLVCLFGIGSWIAVNGVWVELPLLVIYAPEKWNLPSYLAVITQLANLGPLLYSLGNYLAPKTVYEKPVVLLITSIGAISCALLAFFWNFTSKIDGVEHSIALFVLTFTLALVDCTSSVVFLTFMSLFPTSYMSALFVGETLSGMLPAFVALGQGMEKDKKCNASYSTNFSSFSADKANITSHKASGPNFGPDVFFFFLCAMMVVCCMAFLGLNYLPFARKQHVIKQSGFGTNDDSRQVLFSGDETSERDNLWYYDSTLSTGSSHHPSLPRIPNKSKCISKCTIHHIIYLLLIQAWINCLSNGVLTSIQSYATEPYGNKTYHLVATLSSIASALTCFLYLWFPSRSSVMITGNTVVYTILSGYILALAALSPTPPLHNSSSGSAIVILVSILSGCLVSYTKLTICSVMREEGPRSLFWCGISIQTGSFIGAVVMFPLVNIMKLFHSAKSC